jgi:alpha-tubulin suppressor-like RCC1 family protein
VSECIHIRASTLSIMAVLAGLAIAGCSDNTAPQEEAPAVEVAPNLLTGTSLSFYQISAGTWPESSTCGITIGGKLYCWGLGSTRPVAVATTLQFLSVSGGKSRGCAIATDSRAYCWAPADPSLSSAPSAPKLVPGGLLWRQISVGTYHHICGITTSNKVYCWGVGLWGELGLGPSGYNGSDVPVQIAGGRTYRSVTAGSYHSCAVTQTYKAYCWGLGIRGRLGAGDAIQGSDIPVAVLGGLQFRQLSAGDKNTCGTTIFTKKAYCWGDGRYGQNGDGKPYQRWSPSAVSGGLNFDRVSVSETHACGETSLNRAYCWGMNGFGALGNGTTTSSFVPVAVKGGLFFSQLTTGPYYSCGISEGKGYCWGYNYNGQLGDGTTANRLTPVRVSGTL